MKMKANGNMAIDVYPPIDFSFCDDVSLVHDYTDEDFTMADTEYFYFCSEDLEYYQDDWTPSSNFDNGRLLKVRGMTMDELSLFLIDVLFDESAPADTQPYSSLKRSFSMHQPDVKHAEQPSLWENNMPIVYPVNQEEYLEHMNTCGSYLKNVTTHAEMRDDDSYAKLVDTFEQDAHFLHECILYRNYKKTLKLNGNTKKRRKKAALVKRKRGQKNNCFTNVTMNGGEIKQRIPTNSMKYFDPKKKPEKDLVHSKKSRCK
jgi:hypothetical protein